MKQGRVTAKMSSDWCLIEFDDDLQGKVFLKLQGEANSIPWEVGEKMVLMTQDELEDAQEDAYDEGFHACEEVHCL